jgi:hypothetical protein
MTKKVEQQAVPQMKPLAYAVKWICENWKYLAR